MMHLVINGYFLDQPTTGTGQYTRQLVNELEELWPHRLTVVLPATSGAVKERHRFPKAQLHLVSAPFSGNVSKVWFEQWGVPRAAQELGADLLHVPYFGPPLSAPVPVVVTIHDLLQLLVPRLRGGLLTRLYNALAAAGARRAAAVLADSEYTRQTVIERLKVPTQRVRRVHLAVDAHYCPEPTAADERRRRRYGLTGPYLLYMGGLDWRKNVPTLIRAYARSACEFPFAIAGQARSARSAAFPDLPQEAQRAGVAEQVRFLGWVEEEDKPALYRGALLFIFPSRYEGFGLTPLEALACGTPVLCSNTTSLPEVVGEAALLFDPEDEEGLAQLIRRALADVELRDRLRTKGPQQAQRFSWRTCALQTIETYQQVLAAEEIPVA